MMMWGHFHKHVYLNLQHFYDWYCCISYINASSVDTHTRFFIQFKWSLDRKCIPSIIDHTMWMLMAFSETATVRRNVVGVNSQVQVKICLKTPAVGQRNSVLLGRLNQNTVIRVVSLQSKSVRKIINVNQHGVITSSFVVIICVYSNFYDMYLLRKVIFGRTDSINQYFKGIYYKF